MLRGRTHGWQPYPERCWLLKTLQVRVMGPSGSSSCMHTFEWGI